MIEYKRDELDKFINHYFAKGITVEHLLRKHRWLDDEEKSQCPKCKSSLNKNQSRCSKKGCEIRILPTNDGPLKGYKIDSVTLLELIYLYANYPLYVTANKLIEIIDIELKTAKSYIDKIDSVIEKSFGGGSNRWGQEQYIENFKADIISKRRRAKNLHKYAARRIYHDFKFDDKIQAFEFLLSLILRKDLFRMISVP